MDEHNAFAAAHIVTGELHLTRLARTGGGRLRMTCAVRAMCHPRGEQAGSAEAATYDRQHRVPEDQVDWTE